MTEVPLEGHIQDFCQIFRDWKPLTEKDRSESMPHSHKGTLRPPHEPSFSGRTPSSLASVRSTFPDTASESQHWSLSPVPRRKHRILKHQRRAVKRSSFRHSWRLHYVNYKAHLFWYNLTQNFVPIFIIIIMKIRIGINFPSSGIHCTSFSWPPLFLVLLMGAVVHKLFLCYLGTIFMWMFISAGVGNVVMWLLFVNELSKVQPLT